MLRQDKDRKPLRCAERAPARSVASFGVILFLSLLMLSCGGTPTTHQAVPTTPQAGTQAATTTSSPAPRPTQVRSLRPTPTPFPTPLHGPVLLALHPALGRLVGKVNCTDIVQIFDCQVQVEALPKNPGSLPWTAFATIPGAPVTFSPSSGVLAPGHSILVVIFIPDKDCTHGLLIFRGPSNTQSVSWACS